MDCEPGRMRAHARLTYILTGALHHFIEISVLNNKGKGKCSISGDDSGVDSIVEDAERLLLRAQAIAAYALRLDDRGNLIDGEPRTGMSYVDDPYCSLKMKVKLTERRSPSMAEIEVLQPHTARPSLQIRPHKEALASIFSFSPLSLAPPSPPLTIEETVTAPSLSEPFQDCCPGAYVWPARLPPTPTSVKAIRRKPPPTTAALTYATGDAVRLAAPSFRRRPIPSAEEASKATLPSSGLPPTRPTPEAVQQPHFTPWSQGVDEESVVDPLTGLPAQRTTGFEPGPSDRDPGPIKPDPFRNLPTQPTPISPTLLAGTSSNDWWNTQEESLLPPKFSTEPQEIGGVSGQFTAPPAYPFFPSFKTPDSWRSGPPSYVEFEQDNALDGNITPHIEEDEQTKKGFLKHFLKTMRRRSQKTQTGSDAALAQRIQDEEDQIVSTTVLPNHFDVPIKNMAGDTSTTSDRLLAQRLQEREEQLPRESSTQASCSSATLKKHMEADLKVARALQAEWEEEARQQEIRTLKELQAKFEEQDNQDARLAAKLAADWEREDGEESERVREQETTCIVCVERCKKSQLSQPCSDVTHIWCRKCLHGKFQPSTQIVSPRH